MDVRAATTAAIAVACAVAASPVAADWFATATMSSRVAADSNLRLQDNPDAAASGSVSAGLDAGYRTKTISWNTSIGVTGAEFVGARAGAGRGRLDPRISTGIVYSGKTVSVDSEVTFSRRPTSTSQFDDTGVTQIDATQLDLGLSGGVNIQLDPRNTLRLSSTTRFVRFTKDANTFSPSDTHTFGFGLTHAATPRLRLTLSTNYRYFDADNTAQTRTDVLSLSGGFDYSVNTRLSLRGSLGAQYSDSRRTVAGARVASETVGFSGDAGVSWSPTQGQQLNFSLSQSLSPNGFGELQRSTRMTMSYSRDVWSNFGFNLAVSASDRDRNSNAATGSAGSLQTLSISPTLSYRLTKDWSASLGYSLNVRRQSSDVDHSNQVFLQFGRAFTLLQ